MTQPAKVQEPSMEEILASIRRIIADDEVKVGVTAPEAGSSSAPVKPRDVAPTPAPAAKLNSSPIPVVKEAVANPAPAVDNSQDDIDALLAGLDDGAVDSSASDLAPEPVTDDVFELTDDMAIPQAAPSFKRVEADDDVEFADGGHAERAVSSAAFELPPAVSEQIVSRSTASSVEAAFNSLAGTVLSNNARTLEDLVKEMMRPMLKSWLDDNLPSLVERIVRTEIERVSRGR